MAATQGRLKGIRLDSKVTHENIERARMMLNRLGAPQAQIIVSGGIDEYTIAELDGSPVDAFGVGERIVTSPDAPVGVGAVGKLCEVDGQPSMKLSRGSTKATLPGRVQVFRTPNRDVVGCWNELLEGEPVLKPVWTDAGAVALPHAREVRRFAQEQLEQLSEEKLSPRSVNVAVSPALENLIRDLVEKG